MEETTLERKKQPNKNLEKKRKYNQDIKAKCNIKFIIQTYKEGFPIFKRGNSNEISVWVLAWTSSHPIEVINLGLCMLAIYNSLSVYETRAEGMQAIISVLQKDLGRNIKIDPNEAAEFFKIFLN